MEKNNNIGYHRLRGRLDGMIVILAKEANIDSSKYNTDQVSTVMTILRVVRSFPEAGQVINQLVSMINEQAEGRESVDDGEAHRQMTIGIVEAANIDGRVDKPWHKLLTDENLWQCECDA